MLQDISNLWNDPHISHNQIKPPELWYKWLGIRSLQV